MSEQPIPTPDAGMLLGQFLDLLADALAPRLAARLHDNQPPAESQPPRLTR